MQKKQIVSSNPVQFMHDVVDAAQDGFSIDDTEEFCMFHTLFTIGMCKPYDSAAHNAVFVQEVVKKPGRPPKAAH